MSTTSKPKRSKSTGAAGAKMLITAASLTAVIGGWASFTAREAQLPEQSDLEEAADDNNQLSIDLAPLPTLIPEPRSKPALRVVYEPPSTGHVVNLPSKGSPAATPVVAKPNNGKINSDREKTGAKSEQKPEKPEPVSNTKSS